MEQIVTVGRRKRSVARVFMRAGTGTFSVNQRPLEEFFPFDLHQMKVMEPFTILEKNNGEFDIQVKVNGGGVTGQAEAIRMGLARALTQVDAENRSPLKKEGLLTRDARKVERKKYGKKKARKSSQFSKR